MIKKLLKGTAGISLVVMFSLQTAQGSNASEVLTDEANVQPVSSIAAQGNNTIEPLANETQPQTLSSLPNDIIGLPIDIWKNHILNEWLLPERVATVSTVFGQLARKMTRAIVLFPDHFDLDHPFALHYKAFQSMNVHTLHFVNLYIIPGFRLSVDSLRYFLRKDLNVSYLNIERNEAFSSVVKDTSLSPSIVGALCDELKTNTSLISLNLQGCRLDKAMIDLIFNALHQNTTIKELNLNYTGIDLSVAEKFQSDNPRISVKFKVQ